MAWEANMNIQRYTKVYYSRYTIQRYKGYKAVAYMYAYLSKSENECSVAMKQAVRDAFKKELNNYEQMKLVANAYMNKRKFSIQECAYHILPVQWLRKTFSGVIFAKSIIPEKLFRLCLAEHEIFDLPKD